MTTYAITAYDEATSPAPDPYTAEDSARDTLAMIEKLADEQHHTPAGRAAFLATLRTRYAETAANRRLTPFTRRVATLVGDAL